MAEYLESASGRQFVIFSLGPEHYALPVEAVGEIIPAGPVTRLPQMPESILGIINLRGQIVPVMSLRSRLALTMGADGDAGKVIIAQSNLGPAGLLVDDVIGVQNVPSDAIQNAPHLAGGLQDLVSGVTQLGERLVVLLQPERLLALGELVESLLPGSEG